MSDQNSHIKQQLPISYLFPNIVTIIGLCFGMTSIKYALEGRWEIAVGLLVTSAFIDGMDGRLARLLNASSKFGAELDSLTDFINFGVAPILLLYFWSLNSFPIKGFGWAITLIYTICCSLRLARFNSTNNENPLKQEFFAGIPAPCGAGLLLIPIMLSFEWEFFIFKEYPILLAIYILLIAILMASQIPILSFKTMHIKNNFFFPTLIIIAIFIALLIIKPWMVLPIIGLIYAMIIPISIILYSRRKKQYYNA